MLKPMKIDVPGTKLSSLAIIKRSPVDAYMMQQLSEIDQIKEHLSSVDIPCSIATIRRGVMIPEDFQWDLHERKFPRLKDYLMKNPFKKKGKKGKGKKKKKKKKRAASAAGSDK